MFIIDDIIILIVSIALSIALAPKPPKPRAATISDFAFPTAEEGRPIPVVFGTVDITGPNVLWYGALSTSELRVHSMFSSTVTGHRYFIGFHLGLCHGPVDAVTRVTWADKLAWTGNITASGSGAFNRIALFGGDQSEGGVVGAFDVVMGSPSEPVNAYLTSILGTVPAYRGITSWIWKTGTITTSYQQPDGTFKTELHPAGYVGTTPYMKPVAIRVKRILQGWKTGSGAWYPAKAVVNSTSNFSSAPSWTSSFASSNLGVITSGATTIGYPPADSNINANTLGFILIDSEWMLVTAVNPNTSTMTVVRHQFGTAAVSHADGSPMQFWMADTSTTASMNAVHIIYQCLTDPEWGMGVPITQLDDVAFRAAADLFFTEGMGLSMIWVQAATVGDFLAIIEQHCSANVVFNPMTGLYSLLPIRGGYDVSSLPVYDETNIKALTDIQMPGYSDQPNQVSIAYTDPATGKDTAITAQNLASVDIQGKVVPVTVGLQGIRSHQLAANVLGRELSSRTTPLVKVKFTINRTAWLQTNGGLFKFSWADRKISNMAMRIMQISKGTLEANDIVIDAVQDIFALGLANYTVNTTTSPTASFPPAPPLAPPASTGTVISSTRTSPPAAPSDLDTYLVPAGATGLWAGHGGQMARWDDQVGQWFFIDVPSGVPVYDNSTGRYLTSSGGGLIDTGIGGSSTAVQVSFDDSTSHLGAANVQQALDALAASMGSAINPRGYANGLWYADTFDGTLFDTPDGLNWTQHNSLGQTSFTNLFWRPDTGRYYATKGNTIGHSNSTDIYGAWTWQTVGTATWVGMKFIPETGSMYAWHDNVIRVSTDAGSTWVDPNTATSAYHTEVLADTPVFYGRLGDDVDIFHDSAAGSTNTLKIGVGVLGSGYTPQPGIVTDSNPRAIGFTNTAYAEIRTAANGVTSLLDGAGPFSIELWIKKFSTAPSGSILLYSKNHLLSGVTGSAGQTIQVLYGTDGKIQFITGAYSTLTNFVTNGMNFKSSVVTLFDGAVHHVVVTRDGAGGAVIYIDGANVGSVTGATVDDVTCSTASAGDIWGNNFNHNAASGNMTLDELALYTTSLTPTRIGVHYDRGTRGINGQLSVEDIHYDVPNLRFLVFANLSDPQGTTTAFRPRVYKSTDALQTFQLLASLMPNPATDDAVINQVVLRNAEQQLASAERFLFKFGIRDPSQAGTVTWQAAFNTGTQWWALVNQGNPAIRPYDLSLNLQIGGLGVSAGGFWFSSVKNGNVVYGGFRDNGGSNNNWGVFRLDITNPNLGSPVKYVAAGGANAFWDVAITPAGAVWICGNDPATGGIINLNATTLVAGPTLGAGRGTTVYKYTADNSKIYALSIPAAGSFPTQIEVIDQTTGASATHALDSTDLGTSSSSQGATDIMYLGGFLYVYTWNSAGNAAGALVRYSASTFAKDATFTTLHFATTPLLAGGQKVLCADGNFLQVGAPTEAVIDLTSSSAPVVYRSNVLGVISNKNNGGTPTSTLARSTDSGTTWSFPTPPYPTSIPAHAADSLVWDGARFLITGLGWSGVSGDLSAFTFSVSGAVPSAYFMPLLLPNGAGTTLAQASGIGKGTQGGLVTSDGLTWTLGPKVKAQASQVSYNPTGTPLPVVDVQSGLTTLAGAWGILQDQIFGA